MRVAHDWNGRLQVGDLRDELAPDRRVAPHQEEFLHGQRRGLPQNRFRHGELSDIVQEGADPQCLYVIAQALKGSDHEREHTHIDGVAEQFILKSPHLGQQQTCIRRPDNAAE